MYFSKTIIVLAALFVIVTGCKKDKTEPEKKYLVSKLTQSSGVEFLSIDYNIEGQLLRYTGEGTLVNIFYNGANVVRKQMVAGNGKVIIDSLFYDSQARLRKIDKYENNSKTKSTTFTYNTDNTISTIAVNWIDPGVADEQYEYTYVDSRVAKQSHKEEQNGVFKLNDELEVLAVDNKINPFENFRSTILPGELDLLSILWSGPHNVTSVKRTDYDLATGNVTGTGTSSATYTYNGQNLPTSTTLTIGSTTTVLNYSYIEF